MDIFVKQKLSEWNLENLIPRFEREEIDKESLLLLDDSSIAELVPAIGLRLKLKSHLNNLKELQNKGPENTMCSPIPQPICLVENVNSSLRVRESAIQYLCGINQPVMVVAVVGLYRTGKSYLMNRLAGQRSGFALGSTIESKTKGIWMWCVPHPIEPGHTLILLDTEGLGDVDKGDSKNDAWIFCLAVLLSSTLVYNSCGTIDNQALENLHYVTELAEQIKIKSPTSTAAESDDDEEGKDSQFVQYFPNFIWAVRDFVLELKTDKMGRVTEDEYLDLALQLRKGCSKKDTNYNLPRECIRRYFPSRKCFVFPFPASQDKMAHLETLDESNIFLGFLEVTQRFCDYIFTQSRVKTLKGGHKVTGKMFGHLVRSYVDTISSGSVPCLENAVVAMAKIENQIAVEEGMKLYCSGMEKVKSSFPVSLSIITTEHQKQSILATKMFVNRSFKDEKGEYAKKLMEEVDKYHAELIVQNIEVSESKCRKILSDLSKELNEHVQQGKYAEPGGYDLYIKHRDSIISEYNNQPNKGVMDVLEEFLREKVAEGNLIFQTDQKLSEKEKKIHEEKEQALLTKQQLKAEKEKKAELEKMIQMQDEHHTERIHELERKIDEEKVQYQQEVNKAIESKLREQKDLMEKGFKDKVQMLSEEIEKLKQEKENTSESKAIEYLMTLALKTFIIYLLENSGPFWTILQQEDGPEWTRMVQNGSQPPTPPEPQGSK